MLLIIGYFIDVYNKGLIENTTLNSGGYIQIVSGGSAKYTSITNGEMYVLNNGSANQTLILSTRRKFIYYKSWESNFKHCL